MPQSERSYIIKELLKWLEAKTKTRGASRIEIIKHLQLEITEFGCTRKRAEEYLKSCMDLGFISLSPKGPRFIVTDACKNWLRVHT